MFLQPNIKAVCVVMGSVGPHWRCGPASHNSGMYHCRREKSWEKPSRGSCHITGPFSERQGPLWAAEGSGHPSSSESRVTSEMDQSLLTWSFSPSRTCIALTSISTTHMSASFRAQLLSLVAMGPVWVCLLTFEKSIVH